MIKKTEYCLYCGEKMESKTAKKKFCCPLHRVYWNRMKKAQDKIGGILKESTQKEKPEEKPKEEAKAESLAENTTTQEQEVVQQLIKFEELLKMAKNGASMQFINSAIKANKAITANQADLIKRKVVG